MSELDQEYHQSFWHNVEACKDIKTKSELLQVEVNKEVLKVLDESEKVIEDIAMTAIYSESKLCPSHRARGTARRIARNVLATIRKQYEDK